MHFGSDDIVTVRFVDVIDNACGLCGHFRPDWNSVRKTQGEMQADRWQEILGWQRGHAAGFLSVRVWDAVAGAENGLALRCVYGRNRRAFENRSGTDHAKRI